MLVSYSLPNLIGGVSQQPPALRVPNAHQEVINSWPSLVSGLQKRPGTRVVAKFDVSLLSSISQHTYTDPISGQTFFILVSDSAIRIFNHLGDEKTITGNPVIPYMNFAGEPKKNCKMLTVGDTTFLLNKQIVTQTAAVAENGSRVSPTNRWTVFVSEATPNAYYTIYVGGVQKATFLTKNNMDAANAVERTSVIAENLGSQLQAVPYACYRYNSTLSLVVPGGLKVEVYQDGNAGKALVVHSTSVESFGDLPPQEEIGRILKVSGDPSDRGDDYYVQLQNTGRWVETYGYGLGKSIVASTMPHKIVYDQVADTFHFSAHTWDGRLVGDDKTAPPPSFIGHGINNMLVHRGRMVFLSEENIICSQAKNYENCWRTSVIQLLDDDPIDISVVSGRVSVLNHAVPFNKKLVFFADQAQYLLDGGEILSPKTAVAAFSTAFQNSVTQTPVNIGPYVYFIDDSGTHLRLLEFFSDNNAQTENADDSSVQVPEYMVGPIRNLAASSRLSAAIIQGADPTLLYTYRFVFGDQSKVQSAWGTWKFGGNVLSYEFVNNFLYLFINRADGLYLERMLLEEDALRTTRAFPVDLDHQIVLADCSPVYSAVQDKTTFTTPFVYSNKIALMFAPAESDSGIQMTLTPTFGNSYTVEGDITAFPDAVIGETYEFRWELSPQFLRETKGAGTVIIQDGRLSLRYLTLQYMDTSAFTVRVSTPGGRVYEYPFEGRTIGSANNILGGVSIDTGKFRVPIMAQNSIVKIEVVNDTPFHCSFVAAEWQGQWRPKAGQRF